MFHFFLTELPVVLCRIHAEDVGNDRVDVDGADQSGEKELLHQSRLERAERRKPQQEPWESVLSLFVPRLRHVRPQFFDSLVLETLHLTASRPRVIYRFEIIKKKMTQMKFSFDIKIVFLFFSLPGLKRAMAFK